MQKIHLLGLVLLTLIPWSVQAQEAQSPAAASPIRLSEVKRIYIEKMPNDLDKYIAAEMVKKFKGKLMPAATVEQADAILAGTGEHKKGTGAAVTGRLLGLHDTATGAVVLYDAARENILWADEAGDRNIWLGVLQRGGPRKVASRLMKHLDKAMRKERKGQEWSR